MNYPNPCDNCKEEKCGFTHGCTDWQIRFYTFWKQFNSYPIRQYKKKKAERTAFGYENPDVLRRYLQNGPCKGCDKEADCDIPCVAYYAWWDARMTVLREKYHCEKRESDG